MENRLLEFKKNILSWYPFKENSKILNLDIEYNGILENLDVNFSSIVSCANVFSYQNNFFVKFDENDKTSKAYEINDDKFDYITLIGDFSYDYSKKVEFAKNHLKDNGKILIAVNNKLGLKNWNTNNKLDNGITKKELENLISKNEFSFKKFYYVFPSYNDANLIYSDKHNITSEDIQRNFSVYDKDSLVLFNENEIYSKLFNEDKNIINKFANSFFVEISNEEINTSINYVSFTNYRKEEYRTMTIIDDQKVTKKAMSSKAYDHIDSMKNNLNDLSSNKEIKIIEKSEKHELISSFINKKRFDEELEETESIEEFFEKVKIIFDIVSKDSMTYDEAIKSNMKFVDCIKYYDKKKLEKLHFVRKAFIDLVPKNCFLINNILNVFDQEWVEENIPVEYVYYRIILNTTTILNRYGKEKLLKAINLFEYVDLFEQLEINLEDKIFDREIHSIFFRQYNSDISEIVEERKIYKEKAFKYYNNIENYRKENESLSIQLETAKTNLVSYANELRTISNSKLWRIFLKIRSLISFLNFSDGRSLFERLHPVGSKSRQKIDNKNKEEEEEKRLAVIKNATDDETYNYWLELEKTYEKRRNELASKVLNDDSDPYEFWAQMNDPTPEEIKSQIDIAKEFAYKPKISVLVPLYNTPLKFFRELLYSMVMQSYDNWELCLADGSSERLSEIEAMCVDSRIKYYYIGENKGISGNTNEALKLATGDYISLFDHDDLLPFNSLFEIVKCINNNPNAEFIYTDEDKIVSIDQPRYDPHFKPDYSPDFLMAGNYICHFSTFKKELMDKIDGFRSEYDGAQDFDIILRATENVSKKENIIHIPKILYHWRIHPGSTAGNSGAKMYAYESGVKAVNDHIKRMGYNAYAQINEKFYGIYDVYYNLENNSKISILIINKDNLIDIKKCVTSILNETTYNNYEIVIIDNNSKNIGTLEYYDNLIENHSNVKILKYYKEDNSNNSKLKNWALLQIKTDIVVELEKTEIINTKDWLQIMAGIVQRNDVGLVGPNISYEDGRIKSVGLIYGLENFSTYLYQGFRGGYRCRDCMPFNFSAISSICRMYKKDTFDKIGGYSEEFDDELINEIDFSFKMISNGYNNVYTPMVKILELDLNQTREKIEDIRFFEYNEEILKLKEKWNSIFSKPDPYHNINFNPQSNNCVIRVDKVK